MVALSPNILVVEKTVARLAQDLLLANDITVVLNVKPVSSVYRNGFTVVLTLRWYCTPGLIFEDCVYFLKN